jgi:hypothetical protein
MKKKLLLFASIFILSQCQISIKPKEAKAQNQSMSEIAWMQGERSIKTFRTVNSGIVYRVFVLGTGYDGGGIHVINETKELLEIEKLKLEIKNLKR